jgi:hypothetical protein
VAEGLFAGPEAPAEGDPLGDALGDALGDPAGELLGEDEGLGVEVGFSKLDTVITTVVPCG